MRRIKARSAIVTFAVAVFVTFGFLSEATGSEFFLLDEPTSPDSGHFVAGEKQSLPANFPVSKRFRPVKITLPITTGAGLSQGDTLILNLFDDTNYAALIDRISVNVNGTVSVRGRLGAYPFGEVLISTTAGRSLVTIRIPETGEHYIIQSDPNTTTHYLLDLDVGKLRELEDSPPLIPDIDTAKETQDTLEVNDTLALDPVNIDVMIVYTPAARDWANTYGGGINNVIAQAMEKAQLALDNSNTILTMTLVYSSEISYTESSSSNTDLNRLTSTSDSYLDDVHTWRNQYEADLVVLFTKVEDVGGIGWLLSSTSGDPAYGFSITRVQQAGWTYTTIHEMGHNMGCHHHKQQLVQPGPGIFSYSAGWRWIGNDSGKYCSVMTYEDGQYFSDGQTHTRVGYFSNPSIFYQGVATGHATDGDNARTIREVKDVVSTYRSISYEDFESGDFTAGGWTVAGTTPAPSVTTGAKHTGTYGAQIPGSTGSRSITKSKSTEGYNSIHVKYDRRTTHTSLTLVVDWSTNGSTWNTLETTSSTSWASKDWALGTTANNNPDFRIRFRTTAGSTTRYAYIDNVQITGTQTQLQYTISGNILEPDDNTPVEGIPIQTDDNDINSVTDANGYYELLVDYDWSGIVTPQKEGYVFEPNSNTYTEVTQDYNDVNYTATMMTFGISGYVFDKDYVTPINDVNVSAENGGGPWTSRYGGGSRLTDVNGYYEVVVDYNWSGKVVPAKYAYAFEPNKMEYVNVKSDSNDQDYTGTLLTFIISGHIKNSCDVPIAGVSVDANNGGGQNTTDVNGYYEVWVDYNWSGTVTPTKEHHTFNPGEMVYVDILADQTEQNYQALNIYDLDCDGSIGFGDLRIISENWLDGPDLPGDFYKDEDDIVNFLDFAEFAKHWLEGPIL